MTSSKTKITLEQTKKQETKEAVKEIKEENK